MANRNSRLELGTIKYFPFGATCSTSGTVPTDKKFTGQRLDETGLYYYGGRYYDPTIGRFISADAFVPWSTGFNVVSGSFRLSRACFSYLWSGWSDLNRRPPEPHVALRKGRGPLPPL